MQTPRRLLCWIMSLRTCAEISATLSIWYFLRGPYDPARVYQSPGSCPSSTRSPLHNHPVALSAACEALVIDPPLSCHSAAERDRSGSSLTRLIKNHVLGQSAVLTWTLSVYLYIFRELHSNFVISTVILALRLIEMEMDCFAAKPQ